MRFSVAALLLLTLTLTLTTTSASQSRGPYHPTKCCSKYVTNKIPRQRITDYYETSSQCFKPGVVFITIKGYSICANPSDAWVQDYIKELRSSEGPGRSGQEHNSES
ncbi:C-C motif chemokine 14-like [Rhinolophus sinicus]|uniref:C-C motif chemokine 14-like n=1 Tax=Rhinolophus sinicus TaxID=89399 RepID=UPI003D7A387F